MNMKKAFICIICAAILSVQFIFTAFAITVKSNPSYSWTKTEAGWMCEDETGEPVKGWAIRNDKDIYYLDKEGLMKTGWVKYGRSWYYLDEKTGILVTDAWVDNYYVDESGVMTKKR